MRRTAAQGTPTASAGPDPPPTRYERVKALLDEAAGDAQASYDGHVRFWHLPLAELLELSLYGIRMIAPADSAAPAGADRHCCHGDEPAPADAIPGRGARSGLVIGLKGEFPFDGTQFPRLPWGGKAVVPADIEFISQWIDDGCPPAGDGGAAASAAARAALASGSAAHAVVAVATNALHEAAGRLKQRQNVLHLDETEVAELRAAVQELKDLNRWPQDMRNYDSWAQLHGDECPHGWSIFLPWHRMYLWGFEQALQDRYPNVTLPYWDWTQSSPQQIAEGWIPEPYRCWVSDAMLAALSGKVAPATLTALETTQGKTFTSTTKLWQATGPVADADKPAVVAQLQLVNPLWHELRYPGEFLGDEMRTLFHHHYPTRPDIERLLAIDNWREFGGGLDVDQSFGVLDMDPHNTMHIWIGGNPAKNVYGDMLQNLTAALDPIFWAHHSNVDRLWTRWQQLHPGVDPPDLSDVLPGVHSTVADSLSVEKLGYEYAADTYVVPAGADLEHTAFRSEAAEVRPAVVESHRRAEVRIHGIRQPAESFLVHVFLNRPDATISTSTDDPHYAGHFSLFGHGPCIGGPGHCDPRPPRRNRFDTRPPHHNEPWNVRLDVTETVQRLAADGDTAFQVSVVPIAPSGEAGLQFDAVSLNFED